MKTGTTLPITAFLLIVAVLFTGCQRADLIIRNATVIDGTGKPGFTADVAIREDRIVDVGDLKGIQADSVIDGTGLVLAPGFIDAHSHHDPGLDEDPGATAVVSQGVTTIVIGQDGGSHIPLSEHFTRRERNPTAINIASYSGHNSIRDSILGKNFKRKATREEIERMKELLRGDMEAGALGLSTGLEYDPGIYSASDEVLELAKELPKYNGGYISHLRSEDRYFHQAIGEIIRIGATTNIPVQISHFKLAMTGLWGQAEHVLQRLDSARNAGVDISADWYPYAYWSSTIRVLFPDRNFNDLEEAQFILKSVTTPEGIIFSNYDPRPEYNGISLAEVSMKTGVPADQLLIDLIRELDACETRDENCSGSIVATSMSEVDMKALLRWPHTMICSDGSSSGRHPRGFGTFPRVLGRYVRDSSVIDLPTAVHKMTGLTAQRMRITNRGIIQQDNFADLVLFDPATILDRATIAAPGTLSVGIRQVWVNGKSVYKSGKTTGQRPGKILRRTIVEKE